MPTGTDSPAASAQTLPAAPLRCRAQSALPATILPTPCSPDWWRPDTSARRTASLPSSENPDNADPAPAALPDSSTGAAYTLAAGPCPHCPIQRQSLAAPNLRGSAGPPLHPPATRLRQTPSLLQKDSGRHSNTAPDNIALNSPHLHNPAATKLARNGYCEKCCCEIHAAVDRPQPLQRESH